MIVYELFVGEFDKFKKLSLPDNLDGTVKDLLQQLFQMNPNKTLGFKFFEGVNFNNAAKNFEELKSHPFFKGVDFNQTEPPQVNDEFCQAFNEVYVEQQQQRVLGDYQSFADFP